MTSSLQFGHFEVLTRSDGSPFLLGQGAMGVTYKALDQNLLSLAVIKVPAAELQTAPAMRQRFLQEAQMMARLRHPHVANVFFFGDSPAGAFYAMEFCEGPTLEDYITENGPMEWDDAFRLALQAASALGALDTHDLVHRDLKPTNIILTRDSSGGAHLKLIDFGVAKEGVSSDGSALTQTGFIGTPAYASPEQLLESANIDARSDLYALGAVLWFCLTGKPPFEGTQFEVMFHHVNTEPDWSKLPPMSEGALALLKRLLAKFVEERPASPAALFAELQRLMGAGVTNAVQLRSTAKPESGDLGAYEPLTELATDGFGKVWRARDTLTSRVVSLRVFAPEFSGKPSLVLRVQRLAAYVRALEHPRLLKVWHFEQSGDECRLATEWVDGPNVLALLKARKTIELAEAAPLLAQVAAGMDCAAQHGLTAAETAPERLPIAVEGWAEMPPEGQSALLRKPLAEWPRWSAKVCPLRLSMSAQDYVLPTDTEAAQSFTRITTDFVHLCHRVLTGQGKGGGAFVPSPALTEEGNAFFERHFNNAGIGVSCEHLFRQLCLAEGVPLSAELQGGGTAGGALATRIVAPQIKTTGRPARVDDPEATAITARPTPVTTAAAAAVSPAQLRVRELERRRAELDAEAERLRADERLQAEQDWLARERDALEQARREIAEREANSERLLAEEQARLAAQRSALDEQQGLLEEKRREQLRLEQELQLRAQAEFQKLQEESKSRESHWQSQQLAADAALRAREAEFREREQASLARLEQLKQEAAALDARVREESQTLRAAELAATRRQQAEQDDGGLARDAIAAEERRIEQMRADLDQRMGQWKAGQKKRVVLFSLSGVGVLLVAAVIAFFMKGRVEDFSKLPGAEQWEAALVERDRAKSSQNWTGLINWCALTEQALQAQPEFKATYEKHADELAVDAAAAVSALLKSGKLPEAASDEGRKLMNHLEQKAAAWRLPAEHLLLLARMQMPAAAASGDATRVLSSYLAATRADAKFVPLLKPDLAQALQQLRGPLRAGRLVVDDSLRELLDEAAALDGGQDSSEVFLFVGEALAEQARRNGKPGEALDYLLKTAEKNPAWVATLRPQAEALAREVSALPAPSLLPLAALLRKAGDAWKLPEVFLALAPLEVDENTRLDDYKLADSYGSLKARALVGRALFDTGVKLNKPDLARQGIAKLREAAEAGDTEGMVLLGEALYQGTGMKEDPNEALRLAEKATQQGHPEAFFLAAKARLRLAELARDPAQFEQARVLLQQAVAQNLPGAAYFLYIANYNDTVKNPAGAVAALEQGVIARDANCLHNLALWLLAGKEPVAMNTTRARQLMQEAAALGNARARKWLESRPK